jgi:hypothetical protein
VKAAVVVAALLLSACGAEAAPTPAATSSQLQAQVVATEIVVGSQQRVPIGITDHNTPVSDATVHVRSFVLNGNTGMFKGESDAPFKGQGLEGGGTYIAHLTFDKAGDWGVEVTASRPNGSHTTVRLPMNVIALPVVPGVGQPAPATHNPTVKDVADVETIDSGRPPDDMHQVSIADALQQHRPALVVFATPAFCVSRACGPEVKAVQSLEPAYRDRLAFIHVEISPKSRSPRPSSIGACRPNPGSSSSIRKGSSSPASKARPQPMRSRPPSTSCSTNNSLSALPLACTETFPSPARWGG